LKKGITPKNITKKQFSRNPVISKAFGKVEYIEELGEGWNKIIDEHKKHILKPKLPEILTDEYTMTVSVFSTKEKFEKKEKEVLLTNRQNKIMEIFHKRGKITSSQCADLLKTSQDTALRELTKLKSLNLIERRGVGRVVYYVIK